MEWKSVGSQSNRAHIPHLSTSQMCEIRISTANAASAREHIYEILENTLVTWAYFLSIQCNLLYEAEYF